ncbi:MAG: metal-dependent hydrolase [Terriglobales bacterium]
MEPVTHFLTGACISRAAGLNRKTLLATTTCVLAAEAADLDVLWYFKGPIDGFAHHRGITHTLVGVTFVAALVIGFVYLLWLVRRRREPEPAGALGASAALLPKTPRWGLLYGYACLAGLSHILLDFTNNYGVRPLEPFSYQWFSWDIVFIFEPLLYVFFVLGLALPALFALINEEIGARRRGPRGQTGAITALVLMVALWGVRDYQHRRAVATLNARIYHGAEPLRASAYPYYLNPFKWYGVVETDKFYERVIVDSLAPEVGRGLTRYKAEDTPVTEAAKKTFLGRVYLDWAQYPVLETETLGPPQPGYLVRFLDLRFAYPDVFRRRSPLGARVQLDQNLKEVQAWFGARAQRPDLLGEPKDGNR